ncbi:hypothetical protein [Natrinema marinum]|uniref:hypothetical protein n=1 Tax=Natrinema marinum TaxID=2961598 RepID=UPI0020C92AAD|nr:hypothetical protein [Natrinema marinum]
MRYAFASVARTELRRTVRSVAGDPKKLLTMVAVGLLVFGPITGISFLILPELGAEAAGGLLAANAELVTDYVTGGVAVVWLFLLLMVVMRTVTSAANIDEPAFLLLSTTVRNTVVGVITMEIALFVIWLLPVSIIIASGFAYGAGTVLPAIAAPALIAVMLVSAVPVGFVLGVWIRHLLTVYEPIAQYRTLVFVLFWIAYIGVFATGGFETIVGPLFSALQSSPLGWPGHVLLFGLPGLEPSVTGLVGAVLGSALVASLAVAAAVPSARRHWFSDPARTDDEVIEAETSSDRLAGLLSGRVSLPVRTVTMTAIRRTKRAPIRLAYAAYPLFGVIGFVQQIIESWTVPTFMAVLFSLYIVWAAGVLFTLNPLGDLGPALPAVLTSTLTGRQAIRGRILAGALVGVPLALVVSLAFGLVSPLSLERTAALVAATTVGAVITPALATGIGTAFPRFGSVNVTNNREAVMPSKTSFAVYTLAIVLPAVAAVVLYLEAPELIASVISSLSSWTPLPAVTVSARAITIGSWVVLIGGLLAPAVSYRYAVERFDWYALE